MHSTLKHSRVAHSLIFFNSFDFDIGFDVQKWPIQLLLLILIFNSDHPTIDFDFDVQKWPIQLLILILMFKSGHPTIDFDFDVQKWPSNYWFWFWCSKVTSSNFWFWFWTLNPTFDQVCLEKSVQYVRVVAGTFRRAYECVDVCPKCHRIAT